MKSFNNNTPPDGSKNFGGKRKEISRQPAHIFLYKFKEKFTKPQGHCKTPPLIIKELLIKGFSPAYGGGKTATHSHLGNQNNFKKI
ncbi:MAG: hypothetical protein K2K57_10010 [Oscillospiraceae bacterium]|nr:hypothetical protein [Oscillospiraceae bacterium]